MLQPGETPARPDARPPLGPANTPEQAGRAPRERCARAAREAAERAIATRDEEVAASEAAAEEAAVAMCVLLEAEAAQAESLRQQEAAASAATGAGATVERILRWGHRDLWRALGIPRDASEALAEALPKARREQVNAVLKKLELLGSENAVVIAPASVPTTAEAVAEPKLLADAPAAARRAAAESKKRNEKNGKLNGN